ncbi:MAG: VIT1/CCC1 transporter family protein [Ktedonobacterales bacterium]|nr:VIT1/CCC1 transporter family protein [Ktedonobacterales bacterium]
MFTTQLDPHVRANYQEEGETAWLYRTLAEQAADAPMAAVLRRMAAMEQQHADRWAEQLRQAGATVAPITPGPRMRILAWLAWRFGIAAVLPSVMAAEERATLSYAAQPDASATTLPQSERGHARLFRAMQGAPGALNGPLLAQLEGRHRGTGGNALRAAVLGASDGLTSNMSLVMGIAGANPAGHVVLLTGLAGLLAGGCSMAIGEWLSVQSARELAARQIAVERAELEQSPADEQEELAMIYQAKGLDAATAQRLAAQLIAQPDQALDTLAREELGLDPKELGGSALVAAGTSFLLFTLGALVPVIPFIFGTGPVIIALSMLASVIGLVAIGASISVTTGTPLWQTCTRQVGLGLAAAAVTFGLGRLIGSRLG